MSDLPTFAELAAVKLEHASKRDKTITIKIAINTARMMVEAEAKPALPRPEKIENALREIAAHAAAKGGEWASEQAFTMLEFLDCPQARAAPPTIEGAET